MTIERDCQSLSDPSIGIREYSPTSLQCPATSAGPKFRWQDQQGHHPIFQEVLP